VIVTTTRTTTAAGPAAVVRGAGHHPARPGVGSVAAHGGPTIAFAAVATAAFAAPRGARTGALARVAPGARRAKAAETAAGRAGPASTAAATTTTSATAAATFTATTAAIIPIVTLRASPAPGHHVDGVVEIAALLDAFDGLFALKDAHEAYLRRAPSGHGQRLHEAGEAIARDVERGADGVRHRSGAGRRLGWPGLLGRAGRDFGAALLGRCRLLALRAPAVGFGRTRFGAGLRDSFGFTGFAGRGGLGARLWLSACIGRSGGFTGCFRGGGSLVVDGGFAGARLRWCGSGRCGFFPLHRRAHGALDVRGLAKQSSSEFGDRLHNPPWGGRWQVLS
jgi:hypothetical protein